MQDAVEYLVAYLNVSVFVYGDNGSYTIVMLITCKIYLVYSTKKIKINSDTEFANLINKYESTSPRIFLKEKQNGIEVVRSDLNLLLTLKNNLSLSNGVINCLIDYCLKTKNGELNSDYVLKIAATLIRKNITNSLDCYNYFYNKKIEKVKNINQKYFNTELTPTHGGGGQNILVSDKDIGLINWGYAGLNDP